MTLRGNHQVQKWERRVSIKRRRATLILNTLVRDFYASQSRITGNNKDKNYKKSRDHRINRCRSDSWNKYL